MDINKKDTSQNLRNFPHQEGQQNNTAHNNENDGIRNSVNNSQSMDNMLKDSEEQKAGKEKEENKEQK